MKTTTSATARKGAVMATAVALAMTTLFSCKKDSSTLQPAFNADSQEELTMPTGAMRSPISVLEKIPRYQMSDMGSTIDFDNLAKKGNTSSTESKLSTKGKGSGSGSTGGSTGGTTTPAAIPAIFALDMPVAGNQGGEGSCTGWAIGYGASSFLKKKNTSATSFSTTTNMLSPEYLYNQTKAGGTGNCGAGAFISTVLSFAQSTGTCTWDLMPYSSSNGCDNMPGAAENSNAAQNKISGYSLIWASYLSYTQASMVAAIKNSVYNNKPVVIGMDIYQNFQTLGANQVYSAISGNYKGGHCVVITGWDDNLQAFKILNSWGTGWSTNGSGYISYAIFPSVAWEAYSVY